MKLEALLAAEQNSALLAALPRLPADSSALLFFEIEPGRNLPSSTSPPARAVTGITKNGARCSSSGHLFLALPSSPSTRAQPGHLLQGNDQFDGAIVFSDVIVILVHARHERAATLVVIDAGSEQFSSSSFSSSSFFLPSSSSHHPRRRYFFIEEANKPVMVSKLA